MGNKVVKQHFETAQKTGVLKISQQRLTEFPPHMRGFPNCLRTLDLSENRFVTLPDDIGRFTLLKHLNLSENRLTELPITIGQLIKLETFNAMSNMLVSIPQELINLKHLKQVHLNNNQLTQFPTMFGGMKNLDVLDLSRNKIASIPPEVKNLAVTELNCNQNQIATLAPEIAECPRLKTLRLEENCLPITEIHSAILKESQVSNLYLDGNLFPSKKFNELDGYEEYMERYTAVRKKIF
ncbi:leucine-rich repeat-containing protein 57 [Contarinia nasturtii]|uniref:leucine-rich repeat-containing protein 57 n=1 Tax=Contarinia nasturtii TaxID=265458 RepID=UPI0012D38EC5|nr:leucine-rich repeat-containing protein 57 [Contarinia nasturtii]XP_031625818.1 leucine-rich repeat-containing protein 57 [Contarinia nasturtii]